MLIILKLINYRFLFKNIIDTIGNLIHNVDIYNFLNKLKKWSIQDLKELVPQNLGNSENLEFPNR